MRKILICTFILCPALLCFSVATGRSARFADDWRPITTDDLNLKAEQISSDTDAAILFSETYIDDSDQGRITFSEYIRLKVFTNRGVDQAANRSIAFYSGERISDLRARTIKPDGSVVELRKEDIHEKSLLKFSKGEVREKNFTMPNLSPGAIIEYRYKRTSGNDLFSFRFDIQRDFFAREVSIYIKPFEYPDRGMRFIVFNQQTDENILPKKEKSWFAIKAHNIPGLREEPMMPPAQMLRTWGLLWYTHNPETSADKFWASYGESPEGQSTLDFINKNKGIKKVVATVVNPSDPPLTKAQKLSDYVQQHIRNIALVSEGESDFIKINAINTADDVLKAKVGNDDLINFLYVSMLQSAGLDAHIARITNRSTDIFRKPLTESFQFTDYLAAVKGPNGEYTFYDPGTALSPFGYVSWEKQAVTALIIDKNSEFVTVPASRASSNTVTRSATLSLDSSGALDGNVDVKYTGEEAVALKTNLYSKSHEEQTELWRGHFSESIANFSSKNEKIENVIDNEKPLSVVFNIRIPDYASKTGKRLLLSPSIFTRGQKSLFSSAERVQDIFFHYPWLEKDHIVFTIPKGYSVEEIPQPISIETARASYKQSYKLDGDKLIFDREFRFDLLLVQTKAYNSLKKFFDAVYTGDQTTISVKQDRTNQ